MTLRTIALGLMAALGAFASPVSAKRVPPASVRSTAYNTAPARNGGRGHTNRQAQRAAAKRRNVRRHRAAVRG